MYVTEMFMQFICNKKNIVSKPTVIKLVLLYCN